VNKQLAAKNIRLGIALFIISMVMFALSFVGAALYLR